MAKVTYTQIAEEAKVSTSTVSRALRGDPAVSPETVKCVKDAAERLGYPLERISGYSPFVPIGVAFLQPHESLHGGYVPRIIDGVLKVLKRRERYALLIPAPLLDAETYRDLRGLILIQTKEQLAPIRHLTQFQLPYVMIGKPTEEEYALASGELDWVDIDHQQGAEDAVKYLHSLGHQRIATIYGDLSRRSAIARLKGYENVMHKHKLYNERLVVGAGAFTAEQGERATLELLSSLPKNEWPTAVFAASDTIALGVLKAIRSKGLKVPDDISLVGFDNRRNVDFFVPPLTSVDHPVVDLGERAAELLLRKMDGVTESREQIMLPTRLVIRDSCAPL